MLQSFGETSRPTAGYPTRSEVVAVPLCVVFERGAECCPYWSVLELLEAAALVMVDVTVKKMVPEMEELAELALK